MRTKRQRSWNGSEPEPPAMPAPDSSRRSIRCTSQTWFKIFTSLEYYNENPSTYNDYSFDCDGSITKDGFTIETPKQIKAVMDDKVAEYTNGHYKRGVE